MSKLTDISFDTEYSFIVPEDGTTVKPVVASADEHYWMVESNQPNTILGVEYSDEYTISSNGDKAFGKFDAHSTKYTSIKLAKGITGEDDDVKTEYFNIESFTVNSNLDKPEVNFASIDSIVTATHAWFQVTYPEMVTVRLAGNPADSYDALMINEEPITEITVPVGTTLNIQIKYKVGYKIINWTDNNGNVVSEEEVFVYTVKSNEDVTLTANLGELVDINIGSDEGIETIFINGTKTDNTTVLVGSTVTLHADAIEGYMFKAWVDKTTGAKLSENQTYTFTIEEPITIDATSKPISE